MDFEHNFVYLEIDADHSSESEVELLLNSCKLFNLIQQSEK